MKTFALSLVTRYLNCFLHNGPHGNHFCIVYEFLGIPLSVLLKAQDFQLLPEKVLKLVVRQLLIGMDFLHNTCRILHTNIKPENVLLKLDDAETVG